MRHFFTIFTLCFLTSCDSSSNNKASLKDTTFAVSSTDSQQQREKVSFRNVSEVIAYQKPGVWANVGKDSSISCTLFFSMDSSIKNTLSVEYSSECWLFFPYKDSSDRIVVYWDKNIDTKYDFDIVKKVNHIDKKYMRKPFMILELVNDTTLGATYPFPDIIKSLNSADKDRVLFPETYTFSD